jgi:hypothetical protein
MGHPIRRNQEILGAGAVVPTLRKSRNVGQPFWWWCTRDGATFFKMNILMQAGSFTKGNPPVRFSGQKWKTIPAEGWAA